MSENRLAKQEEDVLIVLRSREDFCCNYSYLEGETRIDRKQLEKIIKHLKELKFIEFWRGLMTEDGEVAGSGWCRSRLGNEYIEENGL